MTGEESPSHAMLMDRVYRYQRYVYDFTRKYYLFGRDRLIREMDLRPGEHVVEIGCGTARNLIRMARRYPGAHFYGVDASRAMLATATQKVARAGLGAQIVLSHGYAETLTPALFGRNTAFDRAVFSYSLSMIPDWNQALRSAHAALAAEGRLHAVDFGDLTGLGAAGAKTMESWLKLFHVEPRVEILRLLETSLRPNPRFPNHLSILPARYAFLLNCSRQELQTVLV